MNGFVPKRLLALVAALALVASACGAGAETSPSTTAGVAATTSTTAPATTTTTPSTTTTTTVAEIDVPGVVPLVAGHNDPGAQRIDLVFARHNWPDNVDFMEFASKMLGWDGPREVQGPVGTELTWGPFAIEPYRSHKDLFNVWALEEPAPTPTAFGVGGEPLPVDLSTPLVVTLAWEWEVPNAASGVPAFVPPELPEPGADLFVGPVLPIRTNDSSVDDETLAHELSHAVFHLADKYVFDQFGYDGRPNPSFYPACAADRTEAEEWFGDLVGTVDPFFYEYVEAHEEAGIPIDPELVGYFEDLVRIDYVPNGCFGPEGEAIRSAREGLMYNERTLPVMDGVNRRWAERVLAAWSG